MKTKKVKNKTVVEKYENRKNKCLSLKRIYYPNQVLTSIKLYKKGTNIVLFSQVIRLNQTFLGNLHVCTFKNEC